MYLKLSLLVISVVIAIATNIRVLYAHQILDKTGNLNDSLKQNKQLQTSYEFVCGSLKIVTSTNSQAHTRLKVYVKDALLRIFTKEFDVTRRDSDGQIVETNNTNLVSGENGTKTTTEIISTFDFYYTIARDKVCQR